LSYKEELDYEKQMDPQHQGALELLKSRLSDVEFNSINRYLDSLYLYKINGIKLRVRLLKVLYDYDAPLFITYEEAIDRIANDQFTISNGRSNFNLHGSMELDCSRTFWCT